MDLQIIKMAPEALKPYENNAKQHPEEQIDQIKKSIEDFGFLDPVAIWKDDTIIEGHGRLLAALEMGLEEIPVIRLDGLTDAQRKAYALVHNQLTMNTGFDIDALALELDKVKLDFDMAAFGFDLGEEPDDQTAAEVPAPEPPETPQTKRGEIWQLGRHRLICGDSTDPATIADLMGGVQADLLLTDPPYNVDLGSAQRPKSNSNNVPILNDSMERGAFIRFITKAFRNAFDAMIPGAAYYVWYAGLHHSEIEAGLANIPEAKVHEQLIWSKSHFVLGRNSDYQWSHECCFYGWKTGAAHYFTDSRAEQTVIEDRPLTSMKKGELIDLCQRLLRQEPNTTVIVADKPNAAELHPTVKPQHLLERLIKNSSKPGWKILDPFGGSGSTLIAAEQLGRVCYMAELDEKYCDVILARWEGLTGEKAVRLRDGGGMEEKDQSSLPEGGNI